MKNMEMLFRANESVSLDAKIKKRLRFNNKEKAYIYKWTPLNKIFCGDDIQEIICVINYLDKQYGNKNIPIIFDCGEIEFYDKLVYVILECIAYYVLVNRQRKVLFYFSPKKTIWSEGIFFSPLQFQLDRGKFKNTFSKDLQGRHYRKIISAEPQDKGADLSKLYQEINLFLINNGVSSKNSNSLAEVLAELVGNSREHAETDTLIDIDLTDMTYSRTNDDNIYYGMNTAIINFSPMLFYEPLKNKMNNIVSVDGKYVYVKKAFDYHKGKFAEWYDENDFYTISSFQDKVSGSVTKKMGGRGLTTLLKSLEEQADTHLCYMYSGNRVTFLSKELIGEGDNNLIGFNETSNYLSDIPSKAAFSKIKTILPGTAYNLSFAIRKEWAL